VIVHLIVADIRHGGKGSHSLYTSRSHPIPHRHSVSSKSHSKSHSPSKSHSRNSYTKSHSTPTKSHRHSHLNTFPVKPHKDIENSGARNDLSMKDAKSEVTTKASVKEPPPSFDSAMTVGAEYLTGMVKDSTFLTRDTSPVVKMERMPETLAMKKHRELNGTPHSLTNGSLRDSNSHSPPLSMPVLSSDIQGGSIKSEPPSPIPDLTPALDVMGSYEEMDTAQASEINSAVSSILEPMSPDPEVEPGGFLALATSSSTITTNTVTMATITSSLTNVTSVMNNATSSFKFNSVGRPNLPRGSIRVNFSSAGVLNSVTTEDGFSGSSTLTNNNVIDKTSSNADLCKTISVSNSSNIESTISDIVKSAVNSGNTGGFKSLSPLLSSPPKSITGLGSKLNNSFKSPSSKISSLVKTSSSGSLGSLGAASKPGSKLSSGSTSMLRPALSGSSPSSQQAASGEAPLAVNTEAIEKFQMIKKPDKIIPLKGAVSSLFICNIIHELSD